MTVKRLQGVFESEPRERRIIQRGTTVGGLLVPLLTGIALTPQLPSIAGPYWRAALSVIGLACLLAAAGIQRRADARFGDGALLREVVPVMSLGAVLCLVGTMAFLLAVR